MGKFLKWFLIIVAVLVVIGYFSFQRMKEDTKKASPEETVSLRAEGLEVDVTYSRPSKKGRDIFGGLVPYKQVWRTGANEATSFTTNKDLKVGDKPLPAGKYTLWTIPGQDEWTVIFNGKEYMWGVGSGGASSREPEADVASIDVPVTMLTDTIQQFTIRFDQQPARMIMEWDLVQVAVPISW
ncbi:MAG: DUF2911 domain-containing protein [Bacteroidota bacterium]|nr:DUF2911 domain-containing protein [Bacteroidota bacterium]